MPLLWLHIRYRSDNSAQCRPWQSSAPQRQWTLGVLVGTVFERIPRALNSTGFTLLPTVSNGPNSHSPRTCYFWWLGPFGWERLGIWETQIPSRHIDRIQRKKGNRKTIHIGCNMVLSKEWDNNTYTVSIWNMNNDEIWIMKYE